jgi:magnesium chelatase family protein
VPRRLTITLPDMALADTRDVAHIHGVAGLTGDRTTLSMAGRFRPNHHTTSDVGLIGGGDLPMPGEGSPAHHGMLFLDA